LRVKIFISHSSADQQIVESSLVADLTRAKQDTWFDQELAGREAWWTRILKEIRECSVFLFALSDNSLSSKPCRAELDYAKALKLPILPVQIGSVSTYRTDPIFTMQFVDYREATKDSGITLIAGLHECASQRTSLPDPLPEPPPVPYEYLLRLGAIIRAQADIAPSEQMSLVCELRMALEKEMEPSVHDDIRALLGALRARNDVTYAIAREIDAILAPTAHAQRDSSKVTAQVPSQVTASDLSVQPVAAHPSEAPTPDHPNVATAVPVADPSAMDGFDAEAEDLFPAPIVAGEIRRLTIMFADLVDSTVLSTKVEPEVYRMLVGRYRDQVLRVVNQYEGHVGSTKGDGLLVVFGHPHPHENDVRRAVQAGLDITREVARLSEQAKRRFGAQLNVRVGIHRGPVYLDTAQDDVYGLAANLAARVSGLAPPGSTVVSDAIEPLIRHAFELEALAPAPVKGVDGVINHFRVIGERLDGSRVMLGPLVGRDREVTRLRKTWARAQAGTSTTPGVVFRGEAGIGKSRLAAAAAELVRADGGVVLELFGSPFHPDAGLHPIRSLLERRGGISRRTDPAQRLELLRAEVTAVGLDPSAVIPLLAPVLAIGPERGYQPVAAEGRKLQDLIADAVRRYLQACLEDAPGLLVAEDVHWFDPSTKEVLGALLGDTGGQMMVVLTGRDGDWLAPDWQVKVFELAAFRRTDCGP
jgi:class 3 adenylate cyclase